MLRPEYRPMVAMSLPAPAGSEAHPHPGRRFAALDLSRHARRGARRTHTPAGGSLRSTSVATPAGERGAPTPRQAVRCARPQSPRAPGSEAHPHPGRRFAALDLSRHARRGARRTHTPAGGSLRSTSVATRAGERGAPTPRQAVRCARPQSPRAPGRGAIDLWAATAAARCSGVGGFRDQNCGRLRARGQVTAAILLTGDAHTIFRLNRACHGQHPHSPLRRFQSSSRSR